MFAYRIYSKIQILPNGTIVWVPRRRILEIWSEGMEQTLTIVIMLSVRSCYSPWHFGRNNRFILGSPSVGRERRKRLEVGEKATGIPRVSRILFGKSWFADQPLCVPPSIFDYVPLRARSRAFLDKYVLL